ncbi:acid protease [Mollisia scopiformis]|uniref:Acid protease n=1 Tax=Mollisia scopiformis TaxID=149040 RepID=A0A194X1C4_MOLSC|nr:acid protease [Mollisia scopiformis]KUJ13774.1 acid protease [Mollisia scopiformis]
MAGKCCKSGFLEATVNTTVPAPIVVGPSQYWEGNDGPWSTFTVQVGSPAQDVRLLISTAGTSTWVVVPEGCTTDDPSNCPDLRGQEFVNHSSTTWQFDKFYTFGVDENLGVDGSAEYGFDNVGIGWQGSSGATILNHQIVAGFAAQELWLGLFGLNPRPINFTDFNDPQPSFVQSLKNKSMIPSLTWSYTAGAQYQSEGVSGSLVFGGYDASRAGSTNMSFAFGPDQSKDLTVGLQSISGSIAGQKQWDLLPQGIFTFIDSTTPYIWLPLASCQAFEKAFGLVWNNTIGLYLVNDTLHAKLLNQNASFDFKIGNTTAGGSTIDITLPYASFDLTVGYPIVPNNTRYFPIIRAANDTQYTLGRTFLQEAYLTADYERSQFYLSQANYAGAPEHIIAIPSINATTPLGNTPSKPPSPSSPPLAAIIGGVVGGIILIVIAICAYLFIRHRRRKAKKEEVPPSPKEEDDSYPFDKKVQPEEPPLPAEVDAGPIRPISEVPDSSSPRHELASPLPSVIFEMPGDFPTVPELSSPDGRLGSEQELPSPDGRLSPAISDFPSPLLGRASLVSYSPDGRVSRAISMSEVSSGGGDDRKFSEVPSPVEGLSPASSTQVSPVVRQSRVMTELLKTVEDFQEPDE